MIWNNFCATYSMIWLDKSCRDVDCFPHEVRFSINMIAVFTIPDEPSHTGTRNWHKVSWCALCGGQLGEPCIGSLGSRVGSVAGWYGSHAVHLFSGRTCLWCMHHTQSLVLQPVKFEHIWGHSHILLWFWPTLDWAKSFETWMQTLQKIRICRQLKYY
jgi:hypothetical protein